MLSMNNGKKFLRRQPPTHPDEDDEEAGLGYPGLLSLEVYIADRYNDTTASCNTRFGKDHRIQVTICAARPPLVSHLCVYFPGQDQTILACEPHIIATEADLLLFAVAFGPESARYEPEMYDYFVYQAAGGGSPSLHLLPHPGGPSFRGGLHRRSAGILRLHHHGKDDDDGDSKFILRPHHHVKDDNDGGDSKLIRRRRRRHVKDDDGGGSNFILRPHHHDKDDHGYIIASAHRTFFPGQLQLHLYHSKTKTWSDKVVFYNDQAVQPFRGFNKVITIGGKAGTMAWVDLWRCVFFYDLLREGDNDMLAGYIPLPPPLVSEEEKDGCPMEFRDIAVINGSIKLVELQPHVKHAPSAWKRGTYVADGWTVDLWSRSATNPLEDSWHQDCRLDASQISFGDGKPELLPDLQNDEGEPQPTLMALHTGHPTLSLHDDQVVYLMTKVDFRDDQAWVLAVDTRNKMLQAVAEFTADRIGAFRYTYTHTRVSEYLNMAPGTKDNPKRPGMPLQPGSSSRMKLPGGTPFDHYLAMVTQPGYGGQNQQDAEVDGAEDRDTMDLK